MRATSTDAPDQPVQYTSLIADGEYTDDQGVHWRMRRGELRRTRIEHLIRDPEVHVLHLYMSEINHVPATHREALEAWIRPYLTGEPDNHTDFVVAEFKDTDHRSSLVIEETC